ncbi:hypothetical protein [Streptomyces xanthophaeus]|uniref:Uncharacterized protein n=1 Tax=Streptomyces xanthophaeus TaxID=67385 RepID=A0A919GSR2_9ACTN|nr:hypothetical protein [Streptomyces xanthophaeus]GHI83325.1 hypothetical protein Sxan_06890 [Streptomyces xanthophaeus]
MSQRTTTRFLAVSLLTASLLTTIGATTAHAAPTGYDAACRSKVTEARDWLKLYGRDPRTNDPRKVLEKIDEVLPLINGQVAHQLLLLRGNVSMKCFF